jgi:hypothetical protein
MWAEKKSEERGRIEGMGNGWVAYLSHRVNRWELTGYKIFSSQISRDTVVGDPKEPLGAVDDRGHM